MTYVDNEVAAGHEGRGITGKEDRQVVKLINVAQSLHRGTLNPELFSEHPEPGHGSAQYPCNRG
jgi:hypothetical protein